MNCGVMLIYADESAKLMGIQRAVLAVRSAQRMETPVEFGQHGSDPASTIRFSAEKSDFPGRLVWKPQGPEMPRLVHFDRKGMGMKNNLEDI